MKIDFNLLPVLNDAIEKVIGWIEFLIKMVPNLIVSLLVLLIAWFLAIIAAKIVNQALRRVTPHEEVRTLFSKITRIAVFLIGIAIALGILKLDKTVTSILAGVGIIGLALGFAFKDIASNFMAGLLLTFYHPFKVGDLIESSGFLGRVESISLRTTTGRTQQGQMVIIPNSQLLANQIVNYGAYPERRVDLECGVSYGDDLEQAEKLAIKAVESLTDRLSQRPVEVFYKEFGASSINFTIRFWTEASQKKFLRARSNAIKSIKQAFDKNGITIPFPIRTLDFGIVGGAPLKDQLANLEPTSVSEKEETSVVGS